MKLTPPSPIRASSRFGTDRDGYGAMLQYAKRWPDRVFSPRPTHNVYVDDSVVAWLLEATCLRIAA